MALKLISMTLRFERELDVRMAEDFATLSGFNIKTEQFSYGFWGNKVGYKTTLTIPEGATDFQRMLLNGLAMMGRAAAFKG